MQGQKLLVSSRCSLPCVAGFQPFISHQLVLVIETPTWTRGAPVLQSQPPASFPAAPRPLQAPVLGLAGESFYLPSLRGLLPLHLFQLAWLCLSSYSPCGLMPAVCAPLPQGPAFSTTSNLSRGTWLTPAPCLHTPLGIRAQTQETTLEVDLSPSHVPFRPTRLWLARMAESRAFIKNTSSRDNLDSGCSWRKQPLPQSTTVVTTVSWIVLALSACPHAQRLQPSQTPALPGRFKPCCPGYAEQLLLGLFIEGHTLGTWDMPAHGKTTVHSITPPSFSTPTPSVWPMPGSGQVEGVWTVQAAVWLRCLSSLGQASGSELSLRPFLNPAWLGSRGASGGAVSQP